MLRGREVRKIRDLLFNVSDGDGRGNRDNERSPALGTGGVRLGSRLEVREHGLDLCHDAQNLVRLGGQDYHI